MPLQKKQKQTLQINNSKTKFLKMKKSFIKSLAVILCISAGIAANAQSKSDLEKIVAKQKTTIDSMSTRLAALETMYAVTKDSLLGREFDPSKFANIVDSIQNSTDSATLNILQYQAKQKALTDTIASLKASNEALNETVDNAVQIINMTSSNPMTREELEKGLDETRQQLVEQLTQLKGLLDAGILTQEEYDAKKALILEKW